MLKTLDLRAGITIKIIPQIKRMPRERVTTLTLTKQISLPQNKDIAPSVPVSQPSQPVDQPKRGRGRPSKDPNASVQASKSNIP